ncbi:7-carboxy-7-deazaguanine synthase QueE, partial [Streptomyces sp. SID625]|nr:7-carboxy-7-deazaguanine synthase QueE [Streptomyces sp. SID625]
MGPATGDAAQHQVIVAECFGVEVPTFQGEGPSCGHPALF